MEKYVTYVTKADIYRDGEYVTTEDVAKDWCYLYAATSAAFAVDRMDTEAAAEWLEDGETAVVWVEYYDNPEADPFAESGRVMIDSNGEILHRVEW